MLYETLKNIEKLIEGNEYSAGGVSYYVGIDKLEDGLPLELAVKKYYCKWKLLLHQK